MYTPTAGGTVFPVANRWVQSVAVLPMLLSHFYGFLAQVIRHFPPSILAGICTLVWLSSRLSGLVPLGH